jgi:hypothetical protein
MNRQHVNETCPSNPADVRRVGPHECAVDRLECVYCGAPLAHETCNGCGQFLSALDMHEGESRCERCR